MERCSLSALVAAVTVRDQGVIRSVLADLAITAGPSTLKGAREL